MKRWVFDLDGTLVDSHQPYFTSLKQVLMDFKSDLTDEDKREVLRISAKDRKSFFEKKVGSEQSLKALALFENSIADDFKRIPMFKGVNELIRSLHIRGTKMAVWTARDLVSAEQVLIHTGLSELISLCVSSSCVERCKPDPEGLLRISKHFGWEPSSIVMVGDHDNDMKAAKAFGATAIRAYWNEPRVPMNCRLADFQFNDVDALTLWSSNNSVRT